MYMYMYACYKEPNMVSETTRYNLNHNKTLPQSNSIEKISIGKIRADFTNIDEDNMYAIKKAMVSI